MSKQIIRVTHSEGKTYSNCGQEHHYKYTLGLLPKKQKRPLKLGNWLHYCIENYYQEMSWRGALKDLIRTEWDGLFEEERELLGNLPEDTERIMEAYEYYYRTDSWEPVFPPELKFEVPIETKNYILVFQGRIDLVVKDKTGAIWCVDNKSTKNIPSADTFRSMDPQLTIYPWALEKQYGIKAAGTIYNYMRTKAPTKPRLLKNGMLSRNKRIITDERTFLKTLEEYELDPLDYPQQLAKARHDNAHFFFRARVPRSTKATIQTVRELALKAVMWTTNPPTRNVTYRCDQCFYVDLCQTQLYGLDDSEILSRQFSVGDPLAYLEFEDEEDMD